MGPRDRDATLAAEVALLSLMPILNEVAQADLAMDRDHTLVAAHHMTEALKAFRALELRSPGLSAYLDWLAMTASASR